MKVTLKEELSTTNPQRVVCAAARGDYLNDSLVDINVTNDTQYRDLMEPVDGETLDEKTRNFIENIIQKGHWGVTEHPTAFFAVEGISRVTMAQITRHRHLSFDVQSMRYVDFSEKEPVIPESLGGTDTELRQYFTDPVNGDMADQLERHFNESIELYEDAIDEGVPKEDARFFLPLATPVNMTFSGNIRTLLHVLDLRKSGAAQHEIRELAEQISDELRDWCPIIVEEYAEHASNTSLQSP